MESLLTKVNKKQTICILLLILSRKFYLLIFKTIFMAMVALNNSTHVFVDIFWQYLGEFLLSFNKNFHDSKNWLSSCHKHKNLMINSLFALVTRFKVSILGIHWHFSSFPFLKLERCYFNGKLDQMYIVLRVSKSRAKSKKWYNVD